MAMKDGTRNGNNVPSKMAMEDGTMDGNNVPSKMEDVKTERIKEMEEVKTVALHGQGGGRAR